MTKNHLSMVVALLVRILVSKFGTESVLHLVNSSGTQYYQKNSNCKTFEVPPTLLSSSCAPCNPFLFLFFFCYANV